jgi:ankyrin repeat protein
VAKILVAAGANVNEINYNNCTPLHCAVSSVSISLYLFLRFVKLINLEYFLKYIFTNFPAAKSIPYKLLSFLDNICL